MAMQRESRSLRPLCHCTKGETVGGRRQFERLARALNEVISDVGNDEEVRGSFFVHAYRDGAGRMMAVLLKAGGLHSPCCNLFDRLASRFVNANSRNNDTP